MIGITASGRDRLSKIRLYRRAIVACALAGSTGFVVASALDHTLVGVAVYWAGCLAFVGIWKGTSVTLFDERDCALEERASHLTLNLFAFVGIAGWPALVVLDELGRFAFSPVLEGALYAFAALYAVFGIVYVWLRHRP